MDTNRVDEMTERAAQSLAAGEPLRALALSDQLVSINPGDQTARVLRAHALMATRSNEEAFREAQVAVLLDSESEDAQMAFALSAWRNRKVSLAQQAFERAIVLSRHRLPFEAQYAWFQASELDPRSAERVSARVVGMSPRSATAWAAMGLAQFRLNRPEEADRSLRRALEIDPRCPEAQSAMIRLLKRRGEERQAGALREVLDQALRRHSFFVERPEELDHPPVEVLTSEEISSPNASRVKPHPWSALHRLLVVMLGVALFLTVYPRQPWVALALLAGMAMMALVWVWRSRFR